MDTAPRQTALGNPSGSLKNDPCTKRVEEMESVEPGQYQLTNYYGFCDVSDELERMIQEPGNNIWNGYGYSMGCNVDSDSYLRIDSTVTNPRLKQQLFERPYMTVPYMANGKGNADVESFLWSGFQTEQKKQCNTLSEISIMPERMKYTMYDCVQEPEHIIPSWQWGGASSRNDIRRLTRRCQDPVRSNYL